MANGKIRATIALDGDREYKQALRECKKETQELKGELSTLSAEYRDNENSIEALTKKNELLTEKQKAYKTQLEAALDGLKNAKTQYNEYGDRIEALSKELAEAKQKQDDLKAAGLESSDAYKEQEQRVEELQKELDQYSDKQEAARKAVNSWQKEVTTANKELNNCDKELAENDKYLDEAKRSADGCATSIDKYGNEVKEAATETGKLSVSLGDMVKNKIIDLAGDALMELGRKAIDAAKYVIEVGSSFESQMSKVQAISGASATEMTKLTEKAEEMGRTTKFTAEEAGQGLEYMALAGWKTDDMLQGLDGIMALAAASGTDLGTTSDIVTDALTAFGESAGESGRLADIMAAASSNANTNVEMMGETFKYAAPVAGALGYSMEDTSIAIGLMANAGIKASQAGTSLRSGLTNLVKPSEQAADAMEKYGISVTDTDGNMLSFRDMMGQLREKLGGLSESEQAAAAAAIFGKQSMSGWLAIINAAPSDVDQLTTAIDGSEGAASRMAETMQNTLQGKMELLNSAIEGLGLTLYSYFSDTLAGAVELATGFITGLTGLLDPPKTELQTFIDGIKTEQEEVSTAVDSATQKMKDGYSEVANLESKKQLILDLQEIINKGGELNEFQKFQMQNAIEDLSGTMPELAANFDSATGSINLTNQEIETLFDNAEDAALHTAMLAAQSEAYDALAKAVINKAKADNAAEEAQKSLTDAEQAYYDALASGANEENGTIYGYTAAIETAKKAVEDATAAQQTANENYDSANAVIEETKEIIGEQTEKLSENTTATAENTEATAENTTTGEEAKAAVEGLSEAEDAETESTKALTEAQQEAIAEYQELFRVTGDGLEQMRAQFESDEAFADWCQDQIDRLNELEEEYNSLVEKVAESMRSYVGTLDASGEEGSNSLDNMINDLNEKTASLNAWVQNMTILGQMAGDGFSQSLYDNLLAEGPEKAGEKVQILVDALSNDTDKFNEISQKYDAALSIEASAATLASYTSTAKAYMNAAGTEITNSKPEIQQNVENTFNSAANDANIDASGVGAEIDQSIAGGISGQTGVVEDAADAAMAAGVSAAVTGTSAFDSAGGLSMATFGAGMQRQGDYVKETASNLVEAASDISDAVFEEFKTAGRDMALYVKGGFETGSTEILTEVENTVADMVSTMQDVASEFQEAGAEAGYGFASGISSASYEAASAAQSEAQDAYYEVSAYGSAWADAGYNMSLGLANGIASGGSYAINTAADVARNALAAARAELQINSPSKAFEDIGELSDEGLALGFERNRSKAAQSAAESARAAMQAAQDELSGSAYYTDLTQQIGYAGAEQLNRISSVEIGRADTAGAIRQLSAGMSALTGLAESLSNPQAPNVTVMIGNREFKGYIVNTAIEGMGQKQKNLMRGAGA